MSRFLENLSVGVASSTRAGSREAAEEAATKAVEQAGGASFGFVFFSGKREASEVAEGVGDSFQDKPFMGHSSHFQITPSGLFFDSVSVMAVYSQSIRLAVGLGGVVHKDPRGAGRAAIIDALKNLKLEAYLAPSRSPIETIRVMRFNPLTCLMFTARPYDKPGTTEEGIIQGIMDVTGTKFGIAGSSAHGVDPPHVIADGKAYTNTVACGILASNVRVGLAMGHGCEPTQKIARVDRASGNIVYEMNGKPAMKAFAELLDVSEVELRHYFEKSPYLRKKGLNQYVFGMMDAKGEYWLTMPSLPLENGALFFETEVKPKSILVLMETDESRVLDSMVHVARKSAADVATTNFACALGWNCASHRELIDDLSKEYELLKSVWGSTPFLFTSSGGEQGPTSAGITWHTDMSCVTVLFSNDPILETERLTTQYVEEYVHEGNRLERTIGVSSEGKPARADVQANLIVYNKRLTVGEEVTIEIELVNAGNAPARLVKIENLLSPSLALKQAPEGYSVEGHIINMKGRVISPMRTEEIKLVVALLKRGEFQINPRILYTDEAGRYRHHEPEPISIVAHEIGIVGWLKGQGKGG